MYIKNDFLKDKKQLKISIFNEFYLESIFIENNMLIELINNILKLLKINYENIDLQTNNSLLRSFMIINEDYFLENHFIDICLDIDKWSKDYDEVFNNYKDIKLEKLGKLSKSGNLIINRLENNIEILIKYLEYEN